MFDLLKKKIGGFIDNIVKKSEPKADETKISVQKEEIVEKIEEPKIVETKHEEKHSEVISESTVKKNEEAPKTQKIQEKKVDKQVSKPELKEPKKQMIRKEKITETPKKEETKIIKEEKKDVPSSKIKEEHKSEERKDEPKLKMGIVKQVQSIFTGEVEITESETAELLENLELELIESDVAIEVADEIKEDLRKAMSGKKVKRSELSGFAKIP